MNEAFTVTKVNSYIKNMFRTDFVLANVSVKGEISNCRYHSSGHIYFTLKDSGGALACVMFASQATGLTFRMKDGMNVVVKGRIDVYERDGKYQLYASKVEQEGLGELYQRYLKLKEEFEEMGMFADEYKKPIPQYAFKIGIVTASTGAAITDICKVAYERNPYVQLYCMNAHVNGAAYAQEIAAAIAKIDQMGMDVLIVGRGGGSIEDLWAFNEEVVARAIFNCETPVISAVGHERDFTIADFVADRRAATPTEAACIAVFDYNYYLAQVDYYKDRLQVDMNSKLDKVKYRLEQINLRLSHMAPKYLLDEKRMYLANASIRLDRAVNSVFEKYKRDLMVRAEKLDGLSPLKKLSQGYSYTTKADGTNIRSIKDVSDGDNIKVYVTDGVIDANVNK